MPRGGALEELGAGLGLQGFDLVGEWGLGEMQALGSAAEVAFFRYGYEIGQAAEVHVVSRHQYSKSFSDVNKPCR